MGGKSSKGSKSTTNVTDPDIPVKEAVSIEDVLPGYPQPRPARTSKADILTSEIIAIADEVAEKIVVEEYNTLDELVKALTVQLTTDVEKVRAIFKWIGNQGIKQRTYPNKIKLETPLGYLKQMALSQLSYATMYTMMCRSANIPCVILRGLAKSASYEVGNQNIDHLRNTWNAVYVADGWRIVMPLWALSAVVGMRTGNWTLVEAKGEGIRAKEEASAGVQISTVNEYFFFTDPDEFVFRCFPDNSKWQLTRKPFTKEKYLTVPYLRPAYFANKLQITSKFHCILHTENGLCNITLKTLHDVNPVTMSYELFFNHQESKNQMPSDIQLDKYVAIMNEGNKTHFDLRFPVPGIYKLQIVDEKQDWICFFKIICGEARKKCEPYPINSELGFGPCKETLSGGLKSESHQRGVIPIRGRKQVEIKFKITKPVDVNTVMVHNKIESEKLSKYVSHKQHNKELTVTASVPQNGEYALQIETKEKNSSEEFQNVCNYLLTSEDVKKKQRDYENPVEKNTRLKLGESLLKSRDPKAIQAALDKFNDLDLEDHGEVEQAKDRIEYLSLLQALKTAVLRRNIEVLEQAIQDAQNSDSHREKLQPKIDEAEDVLHHLRELKRFTHAILEMKQTTISEIHRYKVPKPIVHDVMKGTFLLLGEKEYWVEIWPFLQSQMRKTGRESLLYRIKTFNATSLDPDIAQKALNFIEPYDKDTVAAASAGAGTFFVWVKHVAGGGEEPITHTNSRKQNGRYSTPTSLKTSQKFSITSQSQDEQFTRPSLPEEPQYT